MSGITEQLPPEATGSAAGVFTYSSVCFFLSASLLWATIAHREWKSYVGLLAFFTSLSTLVNMAQQLHTYLRWTSIKLAQSDYVKANIGNPEMSVAGPSVGVDLILFYIQYYCYNVEAILVLSWCAELAHSIYQMQATITAYKYGANMAKISAVIIPIIQVSLMRTKAVQGSLVGFYFLANVLMAVSLALGLVLLLAILARYVATRTEASWHVRYADRSNVDPEVQLADSLASFSSGSGVPLGQRSIYDNWLVVRFTLAFAGIAAYELVIIMNEISFALGNDVTANAETVNLGPENAVGDTHAFISGVSASLLTFVVFGTTKAFRDYFYRKLVPRSLRRKLHRRTMIPSVAIRRPEPQQQQQQQQQMRRPSRAAAPPISPALSTAPTDCFELDGGEGGLGRKRNVHDSVHELAMPTPTYSTFDLHKADPGVEEDEWPILKTKTPK